MLNRTYLIYASIALILLTIGYWSYEGNLKSVPMKLRQVSPEREHSDYFVTNTAINQYNTIGKLDYQLTANSISHYPFNDSILLTHPHLTSYHKSGQIMDSRAQYGKLLSGNETLELWDNVVMNQTDLKSAQRIRIDTEFITIYSDKSLAETDQPVTITDPQSKIDAIGMETYYERGEVYLQSQVRGVHEPNRP
ncbi:Lipopolysaccharide export system protein LptC [invertebrate metagenome]|uniref:Lipopolysaccharide export system protein LptC n=1 Tax=invertebrate metagenome TaxID=1711999 RepID=A0A2H9TC76_9ZZZZ